MEESTKMSVAELAKKKQDTARSAAAAAASATLAAGGSKVVAIQTAGYVAQSVDLANSGSAFEAVRYCLSSFGSTWLSQPLAACSMSRPVMLHRRWPQQVETKLKPWLRLLTRLRMRPLSRCSTRQSLVRGLQLR